jgi:membrane associated rhomboid family serine protease
LNDARETYVPVGTTRSRYQAGIWSLVLLSADIETVTEQVGPDYVLTTPEGQMARAAEEIRCFEEENRNWPFRKDLLVSRSAGSQGRPPTVLMMGALLIFHQVTGPFSSHSEWFSRGAVDSKAILENGEWWRLITALTLHSDPVHLLSNILIGGMVIHFLCRLFGTGPGWLLLLIAGTLGNFVNVVGHGPGHISVGFSTAVFAAIGLLCGSQIKMFNLRAIVLPLGAGGALLAMLGSSGERTDLGAHLWGLIVGLLLGFCWNWFSVSVLKGHDRRSSWLLGLAVLVVYLAWHQAFAL